MQNGIRFYREKLEGRKPNGQAVIAKDLGCARSIISMMENGHYIPSPEQVEKLAAYLEVTPGHLYTPDQVTFIWQSYRDRQEKGRTAHE